jgi:hypothetical protein
MRVPFRPNRSVYPLVPAKAGTQGYKANFWIPLSRE